MSEREKDRERENWKKWMESEILWLKEGRKGVVYGGCGLITFSAHQWFSSFLLVVHLSLLEGVALDNKNTLTWWALFRKYRLHTYQQGASHGFLEWWSLMWLMQLPSVWVMSSQKCNHIGGSVSGTECGRAVSSTCSQGLHQIEDLDSNWGTWQIQQESPVRNTSDRHGKNKIL